MKGSVLLKRSQFVGAVAAAVTAATVAAPMCANAAGAASKAEYAGNLRMWELNGHYPVVLAETAESAVQLAIAAGYRIRACGPDTRLMAPDEMFTVISEDDLHNGVEPDETCVCVEETLAYGCFCAASSPSVTLPAATWANHPEYLSGQRVIGEFFG